METSVETSVETAVGAPRTTATGPRPDRPADRPTVARRVTQFLKRDFTPTWRYGFNLGPTLRHARRATPLEAEARRVVAALRRDGIARTSVTALLGGGDLLAEVLSRTDDLVADQSADIVARRRVLAGELAADALPPGVTKTFLVELLGTDPRVDPEDPYTRFLRHPQVAGVADAYCRMQLRIRDMNGWLNLASDRPASSSQLWHRDRPEDHSIVKVFVNLTDVEEGSGPLQYVRGSHRGRLRSESFEQSFDGIGHRISDEDVERRFPVQAREIATGPVGTVVFADTRGLHRGGHATTRDRVLLHGLYSSRSSVRHPVLLPAEDVPRSALRDFALA